MNHSFDVDHARIYGIPEAILISNFQFWIAKNKANGENLREGRTWTYNSVKAFTELFPYMSIKQVRRALDSLVAADVLVTANHNESACDRTLWYAFSDESIFLSGQSHLPKKANGSAGKGKSLIGADVNADGKPDSSARGSRLPTDWKLKKAWGDAALALQPTWTPDHCRFEADKFRDYWIGVPGKAGLKLDWPATWRNWVRNAGPMPGAPAAGAGVAAAPAAWWQSPDGVRARGAELGMTQREDKGELYRQYRVRVLKAAGPGPWRDEYLKEISRETAEYERTLAHFNDGEADA